MAGVGGRALAVGSLAVRIEPGTDMKIEFTNNALARMLDRGIGEAEIQAALDAPDHLGPSFEKRWHVRKTVGARTLEVVFWRHRAHSQVITAYWQEPPA